MSLSFQLLLTALSAASVGLAGERPAPDPAAHTLSVRSGESIDEEAFVTIGGIPQWVTIKGEHRDNPVVLFLHGGPGNPLSPFSAALYGDWEKDFTIVQWDQRGAGRTFGRNPHSVQGSLSIERMRDDGLELAEYLARTLSQKKIVLVAGSWGTVLGVHMAKARPDLFHAYVGVGQLVDYRENQAASYAKLLELARSAGDSATVSAMESLGPPSWTNPRNFGALRRSTRKYEAKTSAPAPPCWWVRPPSYSGAQMLADYEAGEDYSYLEFVGMAGDGMFSHVDLRRLGNQFDIPVLLVQGAEDLVTVPAVVASYFEWIEAPRKQYVVLPATGHDPNEAMLSATYNLLKARSFPR